MNDLMIIGEIGCNHNGDIKIAKKMVDSLVNIGIDAIKFQVFKASSLISKKAPKADYQKKTTDSKENQLDMTKKLELSYDEYKEMVKYVNKKDKNIKVFATPFDLDSIDFLNSIGQTIWKIPSGEINNYPYIKKLSMLNNKNHYFLLSTGMSTIKEIKDCIKLLKSNGIQDNQIAILHCNTEYPTPYKDVNLNVLNQFKKTFKENKIGFSDHSSNVYAALASIPYGVSFIEKHFTLDKTLPGPDHKASLDEQEFKELVKGSKAILESMGSSEKIVTNSEKKNIFIARRSIVAKKNIKKGELFSEENITTKRPGNGISAWNWNKILGKKAEKNFKEDDLITHSSLKWEEDK